MQPLVRALRSSGDVVMKILLAGLFLMATLISCTSHGGCSDCEPVSPALIVTAVGDGFRWGGSGIYISVGHPVQFEAQLNTWPAPTPLPSDHIIWSATRGIISGSGLYFAPGSPSSPQGPPESVDGTRNDVSNPGPNDRAGRSVFIVALPFIHSFSSPTPMPVAAGAAVTLTFQFLDGSAELYTGSTMVQSGLVSGTNVTVHPTATTTYTLKVTNQAGDSVSKDLTVSVQ